MHQPFILEHAVRSCKTNNVDPDSPRLSRSCVIIAMDAQRRMSAACACVAQMSHPNEPENELKPLVVRAISRMCLPNTATCRRWLRGCIGLSNRTGAAKGASH